MATITFKLQMATTIIREKAAYVFNENVCQNKFIMIVYKHVQEYSCSMLKSIFM